MAYIRIATLIGKRFGRLTAFGPSPDRKRYVTCVCDCGSTTDVYSPSLVRGGSQSCGCQRDRLAKVSRQRLTKHGQAGNYRVGRKPSPEYSSWHAMMSRCYLQNHTRYAVYGGVGIRVYDRWHDFQTFFDDVLALIGPRLPGTSLDRWPNPAGNYEPGNVRWATPQQQRENRK